MQPDTAALSPPKLSRRYSRRTPSARCRDGGCPFTLSGRGPEFDSEVSAHVLVFGHAVDVVTSAVAIVSLPGGA